MYKVETSKKFRKALKKYKRSGRFNEEKLREVVTLLKEGKSLSLKNRDHQLKGDMAQYRECHVESDLLLIYKKEDDILVFVLINLGSHAELFGM